MRPHLLALYCAILTPLPLAAQWSVSFELGASGFGGTSRDTTTTSDPPAFRPSRLTPLGLRVSREFGRVGVGLGLVYGSTGITEEGNAVAIVVHDLMTLYEIAPEVSFRLIQTGTGAAFRLHAGPVVDVWAVSEDNTRTRWGAQGAASIDCPLSGRLGTAVRAGAAVTPSVFDAGEMPAEFERRTTWRTGVSLALRYRL